MTQTNLATAKAFYTAMGDKNIEALEKLVHPDVHFKGPLAEMSGRDAYLSATRAFQSMFKSLKIRNIFGDEDGDQVMLAYEVEFPEPFGKVPSAVLMTFKDKIVTAIELFYDGRPFEIKKEEIFG